MILTICYLTLAFGYVVCGLGVMDSIENDRDSLFLDKLQTNQKIVILFIWPIIIFVNGFFRLIDR